MNVYKKGICLAGGIRVVSEEKKKNRVSVEINKRTYTIVGPESKEHVELVASLVDQKMRDIRSANKHLDSTKLAVLTALNTMNEYIKLQEEYEELITLIEEEE